MHIRFNVTGQERKSLVGANSQELNSPTKHLGAPSFNYTIGDYTVDKAGTLDFDACTDSEAVERLLESLARRGFTFEETESEQRGDTGLVIEIPLEGFTDTALLNLERLVESKASLIKKALGVDSLPVIKTEDRVSFPWFPFESTADEVKAYTHFISALCEMEKTQERISATEKEVDIEQYAFGCCILRLGFIGSVYKLERKILLSKLTGSSAFKVPKSEVNDNE
ncbi:MAG: virulence protein [Bacteroidetes bacterium]|nr:virulence protein [Bacteroidota bacterium]